MTTYLSKVHYYMGVHAFKHKKGFYFDLITRFNKICPQKYTEQSLW